MAVQAPVCIHQSGDSRYMGRSTALLVRWHPLDGNRPPRRTHLVHSLVASLVHRGGPRFALHTTAETRSSGVGTLPQWRHGRRPNPAVQFAGLVRQRSRSSRTVQKTEHHRGSGKQTSGTHSASTPNGQILFDRLFGAYSGVDAASSAANTP